MGLFNFGRKEKYSGEAKQGEYISMEELNRREQSGVTTYKGTPGQAIANIKGGIRKSFMNAKARAPERIQARKEFFNKAGNMVAKTASVVQKVGNLDKGTQISRNSFSRGVRNRLERNSQGINPASKIYFGSGGSELFTKSNSNARNIFSAGSGSNPFDFTNKRVQEDKPRNIVIKIGK
jgi:hypothetical protein